MGGTFLEPFSLRRFSQRAAEKADRNAIAKKTLVFTVL